MKARFDGKYLIPEEPELLEAGKVYSFHEAPDEYLSALADLTILDNINTYIFISDPVSKKIIYINQYARERWGNLTDQDCSIFISNEKVCPFCNIENIPNCTMQHEIKFKNRIYEVEYNYLQDKNNKLICYGTAKDITTFKKQEREHLDNESILKAIAECSYNWENWIDLNGELIWVNSSVERITGYTPEECYNMDNYPDPIISLEDRERRNKDFERISQNESGQDIQYKIQHKDGSLRWISASFQPLIINNDQIIGHRSSVSDITDKKKLEKQLIENEKRYKEILETTSEGFGFIDSNHRITSVNSTLCNMLGYSELEIIGKTPFDFVDDRNLKILQEKLSRVKTTSYQKYELELLHKEGYKVPTILHATSLFDENGNYKNGFAFFTDISDRKLQEEQLKRYGFIVNSSPDFMTFINREYRYDAVNDAICTFLGKNKEELLGHTLSDAWGSERFHQFIKAKIDRCFNGELIKDETWIDQDGKRDYYLIRYSPFINEEGEISHVSAISHNITIREATKLKLIEEKNINMMLTTLASEIIHPNLSLEKISELVLEIAKEITQSKGIISYLYNGVHYFPDNDHCIEVFNKIKKSCPENIEEVEGNCENLISIMDEPNHFLSIKLTANDEELGSIVILRKENNFTNKENKIIQKIADLFALAVLRKNIENKLLIEKNRAEEASRLKSEFLANMSHEIRTPMNAIVSFSEIIKEKINNKEYENYLDIIIQNTDKLLSLITDLIDLSKIEAGKIKLKYDEIDLPGLIQNLKAKYNSALNNKDLQFIIETDENTNHYLFKMDYSKTVSILENLIDNAVKYTQSGFIKVCCQCELNNDDSAIINIEVIDTGIGISDKEHIFEPFIKKGKLEDGTGLGLALVYKTVTLLGGSIACSDHSPEGTIFKIQFKNIEIKPLNPKLQNGKSEGVDSESIKKAKILFVEDDETIRRIYSLIIKRTEHSYFEAINGLEAIELAEEIHPDIIFMDINMPVMGGFESAKKIKTNTVFKDIPIIAMTGDDSIRENEDFKFFHSFILKPFKKLDLLQAIDSILNKKSELSNNQLLKLYNILKTDLAEEYQQVKEALVINEIDEFCEKLIKLSNEYNFINLLEWSNELKNKILSFDSRLIQQHLDSYMNIVESLSEQPENEKDKL